MLKLFSGSANQALSKHIANLLKLPIAEAEITRFGNSEVKVTIKEDVKSKTCVIIQPTSNPTDTHLIELLFFCDALKRQEAKYIVGYIPYFGYAKQDLQHRPGECVSVNVVIRMLESIGFDKIYTIDLHDEATGGVFSIPFKNLTALPLMANHIKKYLIKRRIKINDVVLVSPDQGAVEKVRNFGKTFFQTENFSIAVIEKKRDLEIAHRASPLDLYGNVNGKIVIIVDDMVVSGSTIIPAVNLCLKRGAKSVYAAVVHHDFTADAPENIENSKIIKIFSTNTIALKKNQNFPKLEEISIASVIADEIKYFL